MGANPNKMRLLKGRKTWVAKNKIIFGWVNVLLYQLVDFLLIVFIYERCLEYYIHEQRV